LTLQRLVVPVVLRLSSTNCVPNALERFKFCVRIMPFLLKEFDVRIARCASCAV